MENYTEIKTKNYDKLIQIQSELETATGKSMLTYNGMLSFQTRGIGHINIVSKSFTENAVLIETSYPNDYFLEKMYPIFEKHNIYISISRER